MIKEESQEKMLESEKNAKLSELDNLFKKSKIVSLFSNMNDTNKFSSGFITEIAEGYVLLKHIEPHGLYDGYVTIKLDDIFLINYDGKYEKKMADLYTLRKQYHKELNILSGNVFYDLLSFAQENKFVVTIELLESNLDNEQGFVNNIEKGILSIRKIDSFGYDDGMAIIQLCDITHIFCDTDDEMALRILNSLYGT